MSKTDVKNKPSPWGDVTEHDVVGHLEEDFREAWQKLRTFAVGLGPQRIYPSKNCVMFSKKHCYFFVRPKKSCVEVWIFLPRKLKGLSAMQGPSKVKKYANLFKLIHADQVEEPLTDWILEAYNYAPPMTKYP